MKTKFYLVWAFLVILASLSCDRKTVDQYLTSEPSNEVLIREAQTYFQTLTTQKARVASYDSPLPKDWLDNRVPQWAKAVTFNKGGKAIIEVPLLYNNNVDPVYSFKSDALGSQTTITQKNGVTKALFFKHKDGSIAVYIMKLILDPAYLAKVKPNNRYKNLSFKTITQDFSGVMLLSAWNEKVVDLYVFKDGKIKVRNHPHANTAGGARMSQCYYQPKCDRVCVGISSSCCSQEEEDYNPFGYCCSSNWNSCSYQCVYDEVCYPDEEPTEPGSPGDNPTAPDNGNTVSTMDVEKDNLNPCNNYVYDKIVNAYMPSKVLDIVKNFDVRKDLTIILTNSNIGPKTLDGDTVPLNSGTWQITLNTNALTEASQEYVAATIVHEILHVYLGTGNDPDHETMAQKYVVPMANALINMGFNITNERAQALAWGGLQTTTAWQELVNIDRVSGTHKTQDILNINVYYKSGTAGLSCP